MVPVHVAIKSHLLSSVDDFNHRIGLFAAKMVPVLGNLSSASGLSPYIAVASDNIILLLPIAALLCAVWILSMIWWSTKSTERKAGIEATEGRERNGTGTFGQPFAWTVNTTGTLCSQPRNLFSGCLQGGNA